MKNNTVKKKTRYNQIRKSNRIKKIIMASIISIVLLLNLIPGSTNLLTGKLSNSLSPTAYASSLADVQLLTDVKISADLTKETDHYDLALGITGEGLGEVELLTPDRLGVFYIPELAGKMQADGPADVHVEILPITMDDLPALNTALEGLQRTLNGLVTGLILGIDKALGFLPSVLIEIEGLEELNEAIDNLNNLNNSLKKLLKYEGKTGVLINDYGSVVVNFSEGLGDHLEELVVGVVQSALDDVLIAVKELKINVLKSVPGLGNILSGTVNGLVLGLVGEVANQLTNLTGELTDGTIDLTEDLAGIQVIGETTINANVKVDRPARVSGVVPVYGAGVNTSVIDVTLLSSLTDQTTITFDESILELEAPLVDEAFDGETEVSGTGEPGATVEVKNESGDIIGTGDVDEESNFTVTVDNPLVEGEELQVTQSKEDDYEENVVSDPTTVIVQAVPGKLEFISWPDELNFNIKLKAGVDEYFLTEEFTEQLMISDTRSGDSGWKLTAKMAGALSAEVDGVAHVLPATLIHREKKLRNG